MNGTFVKPLFVRSFVCLFITSGRDTEKAFLRNQSINQPEDVFSRGWGFKFCYLDKKERSLDGAFTLTDVARWIACSILVLLTSGISHHPSRVSYFMVYRILFPDRFLYGIYVFQSKTSIDF